MAWPNKNIKLILNYVVGPLVFLLLLFSIYRQVLHQPNWKDSFQQIRHALGRDSIVRLLAASVLLLVNWGLEAAKWKLAIRRVQEISLVQSFKAVLTGSTMAFFTPNRMGEYVGRILYIREGHRIQAISLTLVCSMAQLIITLLAGAVGLIFLRPLVDSSPGGSLANAGFWLDLVLYLSWGGLAILTLLYFRFSGWIRLLERIPRMGRFVRYIRVLDNFEASALWSILSLSGLRYLVFLLQYYLLFRVFQVDLNLVQVLGSMSVVFLVLAIIPSIAVISELGVRWKASIEIVQFFSSNTVGILATSMAVWIINLVIPALLGSLLILNIKLFRSRVLKNQTGSSASDT